VARSGGAPVAAMIVVRAGEHAKYWRGAMDKELAGKLRANDLLHRLAIEDACDAGCATYDMGHTRPGSGLARFKEKLGADQHYDYRLRAERLPVQSAALAARAWAKKAIGFRDP
jgi:lipid II:glycine glycyltransferase (peptidoglycan interpeptide bridge formation enzyme)